MPAIMLESLIRPLVSRDGIPKENNISSILAITGTLTGISVVVVSLRLYVRSVMLKTFGWDDGIMALTMAISIAVFALWVEETKTGIGWHVNEINPEQQQRLLKLMFIHGLINMNAVTFVKISVAFNLRRFMQTKPQRMFLTGLIVFLVAFTLMCSLTITFNCIPVAASWDFSLAPHAKCMSLSTFKALAINNSIFNILTDFLLAILPIPIIARLHTNMRTRITLSMILALGFFAGAAAIVKAVKQMQFFTIHDYTWDADYWKWHDIELTVGIVAASLPALRPIFAKFYDKTLKYAYGTSTRTGPGYGKGTNNQYIRQDNTKDEGVSDVAIGLRSFQEREAFSGKRDVSHVHTTEVSNGKSRSKIRASASHTSSAGNDCDSDEMVLNPQSSWYNNQYEHGIVEETVPDSRIMKTTTVQIHRA